MIDLVEEILSEGDAAAANSWEEGESRSRKETARLNNYDLVRGLPR